MATEPINIPIQTEYEDEGAKEALADVEKLEGLEPVVKVDADTTGAVADIDQVGGIAKELVDRNPWIAEIQADIGTAKADIESVQQTLKETGDVAHQTGGEIDNAASNAGGSVRRLGGEADNSRSVLANMVGNSAQDVGELGGVAGTAGMAIGQLGEYATEGNIALSGLAKVAGPMAALTVVTLAMAQGQKQAAKAAKELAQEMKDLSTATDEQALASVTDLFLNQFKAGKSLATVWDDLAASNIEGARRLRSLMAAQGVSIDQLQGLSDAIAKVDAKTSQAAKTHKEFGDAVTDTGDASEATGEQLLEQSRNTDLTREATERAAEWERKHAEAMEAAKTASEHLTTGIRNYNNTLKGTDWGRAQVAGATAGMAQFTEQHNALINIAAEGEKAFDDFTASIKENGLTFDYNTDKGRANQAALEDLAKTIDLQLAGAYTAADGDQAKFTENATRLATETLARLQKEMHLSDDATAELGAQLGLLPEDIQTRYELAGNAVALEQLGLLQSAIDNLPKDVQTKVTQQILVGDYVGAVATVQTYFDKNPVTIQAQIELGQKAIDAARRGLQLALSNVPVKVSGTAASSAPQTFNVNLPVGARTSDISRAMTTVTRRSGRRYAMPKVVRYAS